jgi:hypothetical protein
MEEDAILRLSPAERAIIAAALRQAAGQPLTAPLSERNQYIRRFVESYLADLPSVRAKARGFIQEARLYCMGEWRVQQHHITCPQSIVGTKRELLWQALKAHPRFPWSIRQITEIIK